MEILKLETVVLKTLVNNVVRIMHARLASIQLMNIEEKNTFL